MGVELITITVRMILTKFAMNTEGERGERRCANVYSASSPDSKSPL